MGDFIALFRASGGGSKVNRVFTVYKLFIHVYNRFRVFIGQKLHVN